MLKIKCDINQHYLKTAHSLEVVDRVSETQLQVQVAIRQHFRAAFLIWWIGDGGYLWQNVYNALTLVWAGALG